MACINYVRVSSVDQNADRQLEALPDCSKIFLDKASGSSKNRPQLEAMLDYIRDGDHIYVHSIDRLARNITDLNSIVSNILEKQSAITFIKENMTFGNGDNSAMSELLFNVLGSFAQFERSMIRERQREGIAAAKAKGKHLGRKSILSEDQQAEVRQQAAKGLKIAHIANEFGVSRATVYNIIK